MVAALEADAAPLSCSVDSFSVLRLVLEISCILSVDTPSSIQEFQVARLCLVQDPLMGLPFELDPVLCSVRHHAVSMDWNEVTRTGLRVWAMYCLADGDARFLAGLSGDSAGFVSQVE